MLCIVLLRGSGQSQHVADAPLWSHRNSDGQRFWYSGYQSSWEDVNWSMPSSTEHESFLVSWEILIPNKIHITVHNKSFDLQVTFPHVNVRTIWILKTTKKSLHPFYIISLNLTLVSQKRISSLNFCLPKAFTKTWLI